MNYRLMPLTSHETGAEIMGLDLKAPAGAELRKAINADYWLVTAIFGLLLAAGAVHAQQNYPTKPIRLIVPSAPGGATDIVARMLGQKLTETFKQAIVVDNRPGGGSAIGTEAAVTAKPDGYTMLLVASAYATNAVLYRQSYDAVNDVAPIALIGETGFVVTLHPSVPAKSIEELIAYDKANPGKLNYGSAGTGTTTHFATELFNQMTGTRMTHVPYKGVGPALNELLGGQIQLIIGSTTSVGPHVKSHRLRGIAVTTAKRLNAAPEIPTVAETVPGYEAVQWFAVFGPKGLRKDIVGRWNSELNRILRLSDVKERLAGDGMEAVGGSPERLREVLNRDVAKWQKVVKTVGINPGG